MDEMIQIITNVGFPIFMCLVLNKQLTESDKNHKEEITNITTALNNNTLAIQRLVDKFGDGEQ